jgi:thioredoxin-like negative regulator of GroEL
VSETTPGVGAVAPVTDTTYREVVLAGREPVLVAFLAEADSGCRALRPILDDLARQRAGGLRVTTVDVGANPALVHAWGVATVPLMLLLHRGVLQRVLRGVRPLARLIHEIEEMPTGRTRYPALQRGR